MSVFRIRFLIFAAAGITSLVTLYFLKDWGQRSVSDAYQEEISSYRKKAEDNLRKPTGWLSVVGLVWLKEQNNLIGSTSQANVLLPASAPAQLGQLIYMPNVGVNIKFIDTKGVTLNEEPVQPDRSYPLFDDSSDKLNKVNVGSISFHTIKRKNGIGVRIRDSEADTRLKFKGRKWFDPDSQYLIQADWQQFDKPKKITVPDVIGNQNEELSPGVAKFELDGQSVELTPVSDGDDLFFIFRDQTSGHESYGAARFLYAEKPKDGKVQLDFNKAVNPPCAFTNFATCPLPPKENILPVAIRAGEKDSGHH